MAEKIRDLLPVLNNAIIKLTSLTGDIIKLEYQDNDQAARRAKITMVSFKNEELKTLELAIREVRQHTMAIQELRKIERQKDYESGKKKKSLRGFFKKENAQAEQESND